MSRGQAPTLAIALACCWAVGHAAEVPKIVQNGEVFGVTPPEYSIIAWISPQTFPRTLRDQLQAAATPTLVANLSESAFTCGIELADIAATAPQFSDADKDFLNAFLLVNSANADPPTLAPGQKLSMDGVKRTGDYRMFTRFKTTITTRNGLVSVMGPITQDAVVGITKNPCGPQFMKDIGANADAYQPNGIPSITPNEDGVYLMNESRIGAAGREISQAINNLPVPWIWNVIKIKVDGSIDMPAVDCSKPAPQYHQIFPAYRVYKDGLVIDNYIPDAKCLHAFMGLSDASQLDPQGIQ